MLNAYLRLIRFDKPIGTLLLLWPTLWALLIAYNGFPPIKILIVFSLGVFLARSAGCAINDLADCNFDGKVTRTKLRPVVTGDVSKFGALMVTAVLSLSAFLMAALFLHPLTILCSIPALLILVTYPLFKRFFAIPQLYLGVAFSFGILMVFIEASSHVPLVGWLLFLANLLWVVAYDTAYALTDIKDDLSIGIKTSAITFGGYVIWAIMFCYTGFIVLVLLIGVFHKLTFPYYIAVVILVILILKIYRMICAKDPNSCFRAWLFNNHMGYVLSLGLIFNYWIS